MAIIRKLQSIGSLFSDWFLCAVKEDIDFKVNMNLSINIKKLMDSKANKAIANILVKQPG